MNSKLILEYLKKNVALVTLAVVLLALFLWFIPSTIFPISGDLQANLWEPAYLLVHHMSPYNIQGLFENLNPLWFPMIIGLFFPLGFLPLQWASNLWLALTAISLFIIVALMARPFRKPVGLLVLVVFSLALFPSSVGHFKFGQVSLIVCLFLLLLSKYRSQLKPVFVGLLLSLSFTKPQLILLFLPTFLLVYFREQGIKKLVRIILYTFLWVAFFCLPLFLAYPNWIPDFLSNLYTNPFWAYPSLYYLLVIKLGFRFLVFAIAGIYLLIGIGVAIFLSYKLDRFEALLWSMALTPLFSPVIWSNDFVLIYPLLLFLALGTKSLISSRIVIYGYGLSMLLFIIMKNVGYIEDRYAIWVPLFLNLVLAISYIFRRRGFQSPGNRKSSDLVN